MKSDKKITMVVMNWLRAETLVDVILPIMVKYELIDEIIISHGREDTYFEFNNPKIVNRKDWKLNESYGLSLRFLATLDAKNDSVLIMDDDLYPTEIAFQKLYDAHNQNPNRIVSASGRIFKKMKRKLIYPRRPPHRSGDVMVSLTQCMMMKKELAYQFFRHVPAASNVLKGGKPYWNGEDIFMSAVSKYYYGNDNYVVPGVWPEQMKLKVKSPNFDKSRTSPAIRSWGGHYTYRTKMATFCKNYFNIWT